MRTTILLATAALLSPIAAQTFTNCNPLNKTCPADEALGMEHNFVFNTSQPVSDAFNVTAGALTYTSGNAEFTINKRGDSPTIQSQFYIFFGSVSVIMKAATGQGVISSIVLESDDLDEVDWEFMGGNGTHAETNYFGKGNQTTFDRAIYYPVSSDPRENFHNYTVHWTSDTLEWYIDSALVRTLPYAAANSGSNYPQTPMTVRMGIWAGGDPSLPNGTIEWAGGVTDFSKGPYTMYVQSAQVNDYGGGKSYVYGDKTGSWQSIQIVGGNSTIKETLLATPAVHETIAQKWNNMSSTTHIGIIAGAGIGAALLFSAMLCTCIRQRRKGRKEREAYNAQVEQERETAYKDQQELRQQGLGGWDKGAYEKQGEDALGGWSNGGNRESVGTVMNEKNTDVHHEELPMSQTPTLPQVGLARQDTNRSINNSSAPYSGGYRGPNMSNTSPPRSYSSNSNRSYANSGNIPRSPSFPTGNVGGPQVLGGAQRGYGDNRGGGGLGGFGGNNNGYSRF